MIHEQKVIKEIIHGEAVFRNYMKRRARKDHMCNGCIYTKYKGIKAGDMYWDYYGDRRFCTDCFSRK